MMRRRKLKKTHDVVAIGNGLFARVARTRSLLDEYQQKQAFCAHLKRDGRGICYACGHKEVK
jgi:hypothetical protein